MKQKLVIFGAIFAFCSLAVRAQVQEMIYQGFEAGEQVRYHTTPSTASTTSTTVYMSGERSIHLLQRTDSEVVFMLDTLDFRSNTSLRYIALQFDHICNVPSNDGEATMCRIYYKRANQTDDQWTAMSSQEYDKTGSYSNEFTHIGAFNTVSYTEWDAATIANNSMWKSERFNLNNWMTSSVATSERLGLIKFVMKRRTLSGQADTNRIGWWLDNIKVSASADPMVTPKITMMLYPDGYKLASSRGARIELEASTAVATGINPDSVYINYKVGTDPTIIRLPMVLKSGTTNRYVARIPFCGFDTVMQFYCVVRDATSNANMVTFPSAANSWVSYICVRDTVQSGVTTPEGFAGTHNYNLLPFPASADHKSEWIYDSALLRNAGYGPGAITSFRFTLAGNTVPQNRPRFQLRMRNMPANYVVDTISTNKVPFWSDYMQIVYDSAYNIGTLSAGTQQTFTFQDTFFYAGNDILVQVIYDGNVDPAATSIKMIPCHPSKHTLFLYGVTASNNFNAFTASQFNKSNQTTGLRPAFVFNEYPNQPLVFDAGISELVDPNYTVPMTTNPGSITVKLKNFGAVAFNGVRISYRIVTTDNDTILGHYDWVGTLNGSQTLNAGGEVPVTITDMVSLAAGYYKLCVWVEDTLTAGGQQYRDHEPLNDTMCTSFIVCDGPLNGVRNIGGSNADYNTIEEFLLSLSRCGMDDSLIVRLAPGSHPAFTMPTVAGLTEQHYLVFESMNDTVAAIYADTTTTQSSIVNLENVANVRFRNVRFERRNASMEGAALVDMVQMGPNSTNCRFERCEFIDSIPNPVASIRIAAMLNSGYANNLLVDSCTFIGGRVGVDVKGLAADIRATGNVVRRSLFRNQNESAVRVENQTGVVIEDNQMYDVLGNSSYVVQMSECYGVTKLQRNKIYTSHGAGAVGVSNIIGAENGHALVVNNMVVCNDDGTSNLMRTAFNIIQGSYIDVLYNSVKMTAPTRGNVAAATFGGGVLNYSRFMNNIVVTLDEVNYALSYLPLTSTTNTVCNNVYFSMSPVMNRKGSSSYGSIAAWSNAVPEDTTSISVNPNFLNGGLVDLRTYNRQIKGRAIPFASVPTDLFGTVRDTIAACVGAFEFISLDYDFEPETMLSPLAEDCYMPDQVELVVVMRNSGVQSYTYGVGQNLQLSYQVNGGTPTTFNVTQSVPAEDTVTLYTGHTMHLPANGVEDSTYTIRVWTSYQGDPNQTNDTNSFTVISRYHPAAPIDDTAWTPYATSTTVTPTQGVDMWSVYEDTTAPNRPSQIYWYHSMNDAEPFYVGHSYTTDTLRENTNYYIRQRRAMPIVRFTQVELLRSNATVGLTSPMPYWIESGRKVAIQMTNIGDATAYLQDDTLMTVSTKAALNNKKYVFGNVKIEPGHSLVIQYMANGVTDSSVTIRNASLTSAIAYNDNIAYVYKSKGVVEDVVPFNNVINGTYPTNQTVKWSTLGVPSYVWNSDAIPFENAIAGVIRVAFNGDSTDWVLASADNPMFLGSTRSEWTRYIDRGCEGEFATMTVAILDPPAVELDVEAPVLPDGGCGLGDESVTVTVRNYGTSNVPSFQLNYSTGTTVVTETVTAGVGSNDSVVYTFNTPLNLAFGVDTTVTVRVWVTAYPGDNEQMNDTNQASVTSWFTPVTPGVIAPRQVDYADRDTITLNAPTGTIPVWYNYDMNAVDTAITHVSDILYYGGTMGVRYMTIYDRTSTVGASDTAQNKTAYPQPYQPNNKYAKQQYIYSASELRAAGLTAGKIYSINFFLDSIYKVNNTTQRDSVVFDEYSISLGLTTDTIFGANNAWKATDVVYQRQPMTIYRSQSKHWVTHMFDTPFYWDGTSSIVVQVYHTVPAAITTGVQSRYTTKSNTTLYKAQNSALAFDFNGNGTRNANRPNIQFGDKIYGCSSDIRTYQVNVTNVPAVDAALTWPEGSGTIVYNSCDTIAPVVNIRNQGDSILCGLKLYYFVDDEAMDSTFVTDTIYQGQLQSATLFHRVFTPGRHVLTVVAAAENDNVASNDTISRSFMVRFCGGVYTIGSDSVADYSTFGAAIDTLNIVGIAGAVTFLVSNGGYPEQLVLGNVYGSSASNTITFSGQGDSVWLTAATTQAANYVMKLDGASNVRINNITIASRPASGNYGNALLINNSSNVVITNSNLRVKGTIANKDASCLVLQGDVEGLKLRYNVMDSGYYSINAGAVQSLSGLTVTNNTFNGFAYWCVYVRGAESVRIDQNQLRSGNATNSRGLIGIYLAAITDTISVQKNQIYLLDATQGAKRGIQLENVCGTVLNQGFIANNMISTYGVGSKGLPNLNSKTASAGIVIDSSSTYLNVFFNTVRVYGTTAQNAGDLTYGFFSGNTVANIQVMSNIFSNFSLGFAYYVSSQTSVTTSNFNDYYTQSAAPFFWGLGYQSLAFLQAANQDDGNSLFEEPYFVSEADLHLTMTNLVDRAQYNTDVPDDIDGTIRPQIPTPTIGAHEMERLTHDMAIVRIIEPIYNANPQNVESDSLRVIVKFYNNGRSNEMNVRWYAYVDSIPPDAAAVMHSDTISLGSFAPRQFKTDTVKIPTYLGVINSQLLRVVLICETEPDSTLGNNSDSARFFLDPAYNLKAQSVDVIYPQTIAGNNGCDMRRSQVTITLKNEGRKPFTAGTQIKIGYHAEVKTPANLVIPTMTDVVEEWVTFDDDLLPLASATKVFTFDSLANLYPTDTALNIQVKVRGWCNYLYDVTQANDTTAYIQRNSNYTPDSPHGFDTTLAYGTWGAVRAEQRNSHAAGSMATGRPIRWYRDSTAAPFYSPSQYNASRLWSNTPQYFHDSTYYLCCISDKQCTSLYSPVTVHVAPPVEHDIAYEAVLAPLGSRVYMEDDTVRLRIANYGSSPESNFPVTYLLKNGNNVLQTVTDTVTATIQPGDTYIFTFDSLLTGINQPNLHTPTTQKNFTLNVWTDLATDMVRRNDTIRTPYTFSSKPENTYAVAAPPSETSFDITRISFNQIDLDLPPLGRGYTNLASYNAPDYPVAHVRRGTQDSIIIQVTPFDATAQTFRLKAWVFIDFDRSGVYSLDEMVVSGETFYDNELAAYSIAIPQSASFGYMRMRVVVGLYASYSDNSLIPIYGVSEDLDGHTVDFLLFVDEVSPQKDLAITQIVNPRSPLVTDNTPKVVSFRMTNLGMQDITNVDINYSFVGDTVDTTATGVIHWTGNLAGGTSTIVSLPAHTFPYGVSTLTIWHEMEGDLNLANNSLTREYNKFYVVTLVMNDDFESDDLWYAPTGYNEYTHNFWQRGMPRKDRLDTTYSGVNAWVTDLDRSIATGTRGNVSYLYTPIINISQIRPDTISFRLRRNLLNGSALHVEFFNFENKWVKLDHDSILTFYNDPDERVFNGTTSNNESYTRYFIPSSLVSGDFPERLQFRLVYTTPIGANANATFGEGCAVDDFRIGRARRPIDVGVIDITKPIAPKYGQTLYPEVVVKNYGTDTIRQFQIAYTHYGTNLASESTVNTVLAPLATDTFLFDAPFVVTSDFPDTFYIQAFTIQAADIYYDNDSAERPFYLAPLDNDISAEEFMAPLSYVIAGDTNVQVTMRVRNFGLNPIHHAVASYTVNGLYRTDEDVDFNALLGRPLQSMEYYNYTFHQHMRAFMGLMNLTAFIKSDTNEYIYNDTITKRVEGITSVSDLAASAVILDTSSLNDVRIGMVIDNRGARGANYFEVGFWIDNDTSTMVRETYARNMPLPALSQGYYLFDSILPVRSAPYSYVSAFVHIDNDNDPSNDTTNVFAEQYTDIEVVKVMVEENASNDCRVFMEMRNIGNLALVDKNLRLRATINGNDLSYNVRRRVNAGETIHVEFDRTIPKSPTRHYEGTGRVLDIPGDNNSANNQTSVVEVVNYVEGIPTINADRFVLDQNYPNPFTHQTTIPFTLPTAANVRFFIMDAMGHIVQTLEHFYQAGDNTIIVDMDAYPAGIYFYGIEVDGQRQMRKMILR